MYTLSVLRIFVHSFFCHFSCQNLCNSIFFVKLQHSLLDLCHLTNFFLFIDLWLFTLWFQLEGFDRYKYNCVDTSPLSKYVMHPFWNKTVLLCPTWIAPNLLTLVGFICCIFHYLIPAWYDYNFTASTLNSTNPIPQWSWALVSFLLFASHTLDGIDGKQVCTYLRRKIY